MRIMEKGQVTIPKKYRERYGITRTTELDFVPTEEGLLLVKKTPRQSPLRKAYGILNRPASADRLVEEIRGR
jgi:AbrB family looped-hinge helix DNA binding protein